MRKILFAVFIAAAIAGCSTTPTTETGAPIDDKSAAAASPSLGRSRHRGGMAHHAANQRPMLGTAILT